MHALLLPLGLALQGADDTPAATLVARAVLPARTFAAGPPSGARIDPAAANGEPLPFASQPVQGFSGIVDNGDGSFDVLVDNGYGAIENSADFRLRVYTIRPDFETAQGGAGTIAIVDHVELHAAAGAAPFPLTNRAVELAPLTGADFDVESIQRVGDGSIWLGDEFGPFLLHFGRSGLLDGQPIALPHSESGAPLRAPWNPHYEESAALRFANGFAASGRDARPLVVSPWHLLLDDGDEASVVPSRARPDAVPGLRAASSEVFPLSSLQQAGHRVVVWTVNDPERMRQLLELGVDGIISDRPDLLIRELERFDADGDGQGGDLLDEYGLVNRARFDAQGHRGARHLRPENTLPAMEAALDLGMSTLEVDCGLTRDGVPLLSHDPLVDATKWRRVSGSAHPDGAPLLLRELEFAAIQREFVADGLLAISRAEGYAARNERELSPVSSAYAEWIGLPDPYTPPSLGQLFDFVHFYERYYQSGPGVESERAELRARAALRVRFNVETKCRPPGPAGEPTRAPSLFVDCIAREVNERALSERVDLQSFELRSLDHAMQEHPELGRVLLFGDWPEAGGGGDNLQPRSDGSQPWLGGRSWPYRSTRTDDPPLVPLSGGVEGLALTLDGQYLLALLEAPLAGAERRELRMLEFHLGTREFTGVEHRYPLELRGAAIGDFVMHSPTHGLVIERDWTEGDLDGFKRLYEIKLNPEGGRVSKALVADLLDIADPHGISLPAEEGDVGLGERFAFPFVTIEDVVVLGPRKVGLLNDNNYPFSVGRHVGSGRPDDTEFIVLELARELGSYAR